MVFESCTSRVMVINMCAFVLIFFHVSSAIQLEREALLNTGWWNGYSNTSDHCKWYGISCNSDGFISEINLMYQGIKGDLSKFNFSCFAKLQSLDLGGNYLTGTIPPQIGALSTLTALKLGTNILTGQLPSYKFSFNQLYIYIYIHQILEGYLLTHLFNYHVIRCYPARNWEPKESEYAVFG